MTRDPGFYRLDTGLRISEAINDLGECGVQASVFSLTLFKTFFDFR